MRHSIAVVAASLFAMQLLAACGPSAAKVAARAEAKRLKDECTKRLTDGDLRLRAPASPNPASRVGGRWRCQASGAPYTLTIVQEGSHVAFVVAGYSSSGSGEGRIDGAHVLLKSKDAEGLQELDATGATILTGTFVAPDETGTCAETPINCTRN